MAQCDGSLPLQTPMVVATQCMYTGHGAVFTTKGGRGEKGGREVDDCLVRWVSAALIHYHVFSPVTLDACKLRCITTYACKLRGIITYCVSDQDQLYITNLIV